LPFKSFHLLCKSGFAEACVVGQSKARSMMLELMCGAWAFFASSSCMAPHLLKRRNTQTHTSGNLYVHLARYYPRVVNSRENLMVVEVCIRWMKYVPHDSTWRGEIAGFSVNVQNCSR
jgi:hypothetical protein